MSFFGQTHITYPFSAIIFVKRGSFLGEDIGYAYPPYKGTHTHIKDILGYAYPQLPVM
jgi:hypothetical protein